VGRIEAPRAGQNVSSSSGLLVTGWAADTTAQGWSGVDGVEVWSGAQGSGGTKLATGSVGLRRPDIAEALGSSYANSGFSAVIPASAWSNVSPGGVNLNVYIHSPSKGSWYRTVAVGLVQVAALPYPSDPLVYIAKPQDGMNITQKQVTNKISFSGVALDRNPLSAVQGQLSLLPAGTGQTLTAGCSACAGANGNIYTNYRGQGVDTITAYIDAPPKPGDYSQPALFGAPCGSCTQGVSILVSSKGSLNAAGKPQASIISDAYGLQVSGDPQQFRFGGWSISLNPAILSPGPHTLYVTAHSTVTGKNSTAKSMFNIIGYTNNQQRIQP
jgi:hypothetical protein